MARLKNKSKTINSLSSVFGKIKNIVITIFNLFYLDRIVGFYIGLTDRVKSSIVLFTICMLAIIVGDIFVNILFVLAGFLMLLEWDRMFNKNAKLLYFNFSLFFLMNVVVFVLSTLSVFILDSYTIATIILVLGFIKSMFTSIYFKKDRFILESLPSIYISGAVISSIYVYNRLGLPSLILLFVITVATDTFAYFIGSYFGGAKLMPAVSPNKTISGAIGGVIGAFICSCVYLLILFFLGFTDIISNLHLFGLLAIILSILAQCGDLFESYCKRLCFVKDSGNLIRGHGGMLDRFDSFIVVVPIYSIIAILSLSLL